MSQLAGFLPLEDVVFTAVPGRRASVGQRFELVAGGHKRQTAELRDHSSWAVCLTATTVATAPNTTKQPTTVLSAVQGLVKKGCIRCHALVTAASEEGSTAHVLLAVVLDNSAWDERRSRWLTGDKAGSGDKAALLFARLVPAVVGVAAEGGPPPPQQQEQPASYLERLWQDLREGGMKEAGSDAEAFSLSGCFRTLPMKPMQALTSILRAADPMQPCYLAEVPEPVLRNILGRLDDRSLMAAANACRRLHELSVDVAPFLNLSLFPHQREAVEWMEQRELATGPVPHPTLCAFQCLELGPEDDPFEAAPEHFGITSLCSGSGSGGKGAAAAACLVPGLPFWGDTATGKLYPEEPQEVMDHPGGLFCDDPGLGKTITVLALVLRKLRKLPTPPPCAVTTWVRPGEHGYYTLPQAAAVPASQLGCRRSRRSRHGSLKRAQSRASASGGTELQASELLEEDLGALAGRIRRQRRSPSQQPEQQQQQPKEGAGASVAAAAAPASSGDVEGRNSLGEGRAAENIWVQCELCKKWRLLPDGHQAPPGDWLCAMNPDDELQWQGCQAPEQEWTVSAACVLSSPGWMKAGSGQGSPRNVAFYRSLLQQHPDHVAFHSPLCWLSRQPLAKLMMAPFTVELERRRWFPDYGLLFQQMELEPVLKQQQKQQKQQKQRQKQGRGVGKAGGRGSGGSRGRGRAGRSSWGSWDSSGSEEETDENFGMPDAAIAVEPEEEEQQQEEAGSTAAAGSNRKRRRRRWSGSMHDATTWQRPASHAELELDLAALQQALAEGPLPGMLRILLSCVTLVVVPQLEHIEHWLYQIRQHVRPEVEVRVLLYTPAAKKAARRQGRELTAEVLAWESDVILTTFQQLSNEWRDPVSPLSQIHFLRVVLDEGHSIGGSDSTNKHLMATDLHAERRWIMTGTPTPNTPDAAVENLRPLLAFLHQQPWAAEEQFWKRAVQEPFQARQEVGRLRLLCLLHRCMIRASKEELISLGIPPLHIKPPSLLAFCPAHAHSYNNFVDIIRFNLVTADWGDEDNKESLLNPANSKRANQTLNNLRKSCNVAGNCVLQVQERDIVEIMQLLTHRHLSTFRQQAAGPSAAAAAAASAGSPGKHRMVQQAALPPLQQLLAEAGREWVARVPHIRACLEEGGACDRCSAGVRVLCVTPCACLLCVDCLSLGRTRCPRCSAPYIMQGVDDPARLRDNPRPKWSVPVELLEWQPAYTQRGAKGIEEGFWQTDWQHTQSTKCVHLLSRLLEVGAAVPHGSGKLPPSKAIVYTQFWEHMQVVERYLREHGVVLAVLRRSDKSGDKELALGRFRDPLSSVGVLVMDSTGQVGLDLSFVSHVFLMEPIMDLSIEEQVVSRAHRMGARRTVHVETLAMKGTVEEDIVRQRRQQQQQVRPATAARGIVAAAGGAAAVGAAGAAAGSVAAGGPAMADAGKASEVAGPSMATAAAAVPPHSRGKAALEKRNALFRALRPVPVRCLQEFEDLPGAAPAQVGEPPPPQQPELGGRLQQGLLQQQAPQQQGASFPERHVWGGSGDSEGEEGGGG